VTTVILKFLLQYLDNIAIKFLLFWFLVFFFSFFLSSVVFWFCLLFFFLPAILYWRFAISTTVVSLVLQNLVCLIRWLRMSVAIFWYQDDL